VKQHKEIFVFQTKTPAIRSSVSAACYNSDGRYIVAAGTHGPLRIYSTTGPYHRPEKEVEKAHLTGSETSSVKISQDGFRVISRGGDDTMKGLAFLFFFLSGWPFHVV